MKNKIAKILCVINENSTEKEVKSNNSIDGILHFGISKNKKLVAAFVIMNNGCRFVNHDDDIDGMFMSHTSSIIIGCNKAINITMNLT